MRTTAFILCLFALSLHAQNAPPTEVVAPDPVPPRTAEHSLLAGNEFADLLADEMPSSYDWLQATVNVEEKAAGVSWAPLLTANRYNELFSETRYSIGQKDGKTTFGAVLRWNPLSPRSTRGMKAWERTVAKGFSDEYATLRGLRWEALGLQDDYLSLENPDIPRLVAEANEPIRKLQELEFKLLAGESVDLAEKARLEAEIEAHAKKLTDARRRAQEARRKRFMEAIRTKRAEFAALPTDDPRREALLAEIEQTLGRISPAGSELSVIENEIAAAEKAVAKKNAAVVAAYEDALFSQHMPIISLSYSATLFPGIGSSFVDADADGLDDNAHRLAARSLLMSGLIRFGPARQLSLAVGRSWKRSSAEEGAAPSKSDNYAVTFARRLKILDPEYQKSEDYLASLFVPSIVGGLSAELSECDSPVEDCQDKAERILAITPFVDVKVKKAMQFRVGVNWKKFSGSAVADEDLGVITLIGLQLGLPN